MTREHWHMPALANYSNAELIDKLQRQYPISVTTWSNCASGCGKPARGGGYCSACVQLEMAKRGATVEATGGLLRALHQRVELAETIQQCMDNLREQMGKDAGK